MLRHQKAIAMPLAALERMASEAKWPARMQKLAPGPLTGNREVWLDGGHNPAAARQVAGFVRQAFDDGTPLWLIFASLANKDPAGMLEPFRGIAAHVQTVPVADHACFAPDELAGIAVGLGFAVSAHGSVDEALAEVPEGARVLVFGSLYLAGQVLAANGEIPD
jgi:dihydrofolate synthase/folylpolyglutamate synthase